MVSPLCSGKTRLPIEYRPSPRDCIITDVDQFESVFRSAVKERLGYEPIRIGSVIVVTDREADQASAFEASVRGFLGVLADASPSWTLVTGGEFDTIGGLLEIIERAEPDLVCTYRHLHSAEWRDPRTLGDFVEALTQATTHPILVLPHPEAQRASPHAVKNTDKVMAITDHLTGDHRLVNYAVRFTEHGGTVFLTHVEDEATFERYMGIISRISEIDTDVARETIHRQLVKEPRDYIASCRRILQDAGVSIRVEEIVILGHRISEYRKLIEEHEVDLLVFNTKDEDQLAMHGLAYPLAVELRQIPLLML